MGEANKPYGGRLASATQIKAVQNHFVPDTIRYCWKGATSNGGEGLYR